MDIWTSDKRSKVMASIKSKNTKPEKLLRSLLHRKGYRFRIHKKELPGKPDIVFTKQNLAIFVNGCFWHLHTKCIDGKIPKTNTDFWQNKLLKNVERDKKHIEALQSSGWNVIVIWECEIEKHPQVVLDRIELLIQKSQHSSAGLNLTSL